MSSYLDGDLIYPPEVSNGRVIRVEGMWQHRHDLYIPMPKSRHHRSTWLKLGAGSLLLGAICVFANNDLISTYTPAVKEAKSSFPKGQDPAAALTKLQDIVDSAPATAGKTETQVASLPFTVVPTERPIIKSGKSGGPDMVKVSTANYAGVLRYDQCDPRCDSRDPLVIGTVQPTASQLPNTIPAETADFDHPNQAVEIGAAALIGAGNVLTQTAALPFTTLKLGRDAVIKISGLD